MATLDDLMNTQRAEMQQLAQSENLSMPGFETKPARGLGGLTRDQWIWILAGVLVIGVFAYFMLKKNSASASTTGTPIPVNVQNETFNNSRHVKIGKKIGTANKIGATQPTTTGTGVSQTPTQPSAAQTPSNKVNLPTLFNVAPSPKYQKPVTGNTPFAPQSSLTSVANHYHIPMHVNTHGQTAVFLAGMQNGVPQVAKYSNTGQFLGTYAQKNLLGTTPTIGSIVNGQYKPPGHVYIASNGAVIPA